ncbi:hypothetical protein NLJ89_g4591 [Agrocybe chaxingu]|uniref:DUF1996 domain-containing protein n=1 Tax=Agrocybe chaxingu TaxID=84603 RepID=A0A9W8K8J0_9AGAR|nr:hypothetical protein NLJ89_g4591 [Agrocybe chaxingu]
MKANIFNDASRSSNKRSGFASLLLALGLVENAHAYWLMAANNVLTTQRIDPIVDTGQVSTHAHSILGASNFGLNTSTAALRLSDCTSIPVREDKSNYCIHAVLVDRYAWGDNGLSGRFPDVLRRVPPPVLVPKNHSQDSVGDPTLRTFDPSSFAQQAVTFLCLDFNGASARFNELPRRRCPSGIRSQINFPSCWDGINTDSVDHQSHVAFLSSGPDNGTCSDPQFPKTLPRIFLEVYWYTQAFDDFRRQAKVPSQPFVFSNGDPIDYSYHADFINGWDVGVLERAVNECNCNPYGDPSCCVAKGIFSMNQSSRCYISDTVDELSAPVLLLFRGRPNKGHHLTALGTLDALPGNNPVQAHCYERFIDFITPALLSPVHVFNSTDQPPPRGTTARPAQTAIVSQRVTGRCIGNSTQSLHPIGVMTILSVLVLLSVRALV